MARGHSYLWTPRLVILGEVVTNLVIALAAVAIGDGAVARRDTRGPPAGPAAHGCSPCSRAASRRRTASTPG